MIDVLIDFRHHIRSSAIQTSSLVGCLASTDLPSYANILPIQSSNVWSDRNDEDFKRASVIKEIYKTEHDYLGHLKNLVDVSQSSREGEIERGRNVLGIFEEDAITDGFIYGKTN